MKKIIVSAIVLTSIPASASSISCRNLDDFRRQVNIIETSGGPVIQASVDDYGSGHSARDTIIAKQKVVKGGTEYTGWNLVFNTYPNITPDIDYRKVDGDREELFLGVFSKGLRTSFHGEYACIKDGYLGITIVGDEPDGGYSLTYSFDN
jgi:hypothetical protein